MRQIFKVCCQYYYFEFLISLSFTHDQGQGWILTSLTLGKRSGEEIVFLDFVFHITGILSEKALINITQTKK